MSDPIVPTKLDHTLARKKTQKAAEQAPILALLGLTPVYTAQGLAERRHDIRTSAAQSYDEKLAWFVSEAAQARAEAMATAGAAVILEIDAILAASPLISTAGPSTHWTIWTYIRTRAQRGEELWPRWTPAMVKPRAWVDPEAVYAVLAASPVPLGSTAIADALGGATILDVAEAERTLRAAGRIVAVETRNRFRGFTTAERAA